MIFLQESLRFQAGWKSWSGFLHSVEMSHSALIPTRVWRFDAAGACLHRTETRKASHSVLLTNQQSVQSNSNCGGPLTASRSSDCKASQAGKKKKKNSTSRQTDRICVEKGPGHGGRTRGKDKTRNGSPGCKEVICQAM